MRSWFCNKLRLNCKAFAWHSIYVTAEKGAMLLKKSELFREIWFSWTVYVLERVLF